MAAGYREIHSRAGIGAFSPFRWTNVQRISPTLQSPGLHDHIHHLHEMLNVFLVPGVGSLRVVRDLHRSKHQSPCCVLDWAAAHPWCKKNCYSIINGLFTLALTGSGLRQVSDKRIRSCSCAYGQFNLTATSLPSTFQVHVKRKILAHAQAKPSGWLSCRVSQKMVSEI
jgi:hypothetical protein